jgi:hypothetical protein
LSPNRKSSFPRSQPWKVARFRSSSFRKSRDSTLQSRM